jgi:hypothetical protein
MSRNDTTHGVSSVEEGDLKAAEQLLPLVYDELRKLAAVKLAHERPGQRLPGDGPGARGLFAADRRR